MSASANSILLFTKKRGSNEPGSFFIASDEELNVLKQNKDNESDYLITLSDFFEKVGKENVTQMATLLNIKHDPKTLNAEDLTKIDHTLLNSLLKNLVEIYNEASNSITLLNHTSNKLKRKNHNNDSQNETLFLPHEQNYFSNSRLRKSKEGEIKVTFTVTPAEEEKDIKYTITVEKGSNTLSKIVNIDTFDKFYSTLITFEIEQITNDNTQVFTVKRGCEGYDNLSNTINKFINEKKESTSSIVYNK